MAKLIAIADDLTGAADCVVAWATYGVTATVTLHGEPHPDLGLCWPEADVVSIDANTRGITAERAAGTTASLVELFCAHSAGAILFKKVDSTLRGNLAAELAAALHGYRRTSTGKALAMILAPALPAQGRTTIGGRQMVQGRPLEETDLWKSEARPPRSNISEVLAESGLSCTVIDVATVRAGTCVLAERLGKAASGVDVLICDAETDDDLRVIARSAIEGGFSLVAGSAGLAGQFPTAMGLQKRRSSRYEAVFTAGPTLIVVGSAASISREQEKALAAGGDVATVRITPDTALNALVGPAQIIEALQRGRDTLVVLEGGSQWSACEAQLFAKALSSLVKPCAGLIGGLVATGGETARAILDGLAIDRLRLLGEVEPGLPFSVAEGWAHPFPVLTKAGAFGSAQTLIRCREFVRHLERASKPAMPSTFTPQES